MVNPVQEHYQKYPYPQYPLLASVRRCDTYALNLHALWGRFNGTMPPPEAERILIAGSGTFAPYPWAVANPDVPITALDLSERSLRRARWHCFLHGKWNVTFRCGDLSSQGGIDGEFGLIDSYGVLHHLEDPVAGLKSLERRLVPGGILRIMLYSRYARREEESIRRALKIIGIDSPQTARCLFSKAATGSRLANYLTTADEAASTSGLADALLHPRVHTYRIDELLEIISQTGLEPLLFVHRDAREDPADEIMRIRMLEKERTAPGNFVLYLGRDIKRQAGKSSGMIMLNPCLKSAVSRLSLGSLHLPPRLGIANPSLDYQERSFLRRFLMPVRCSDVPDGSADQIARYKRQLILINFSPGCPPSRPD
ncbi:MAG: class I SAM-dependent methyltransferase [Desulfuromonadaceae bacterium]|nr:class I SAM-dependent methyltransferase [Desulfuromonadaceae bacterium]MDD5106345.1 class I SAM-dependent methyltransferase [Desulfuromonadaceae bacterium]